MMRKKTYLITLPLMLLLGFMTVNAFAFFHKKSDKPAVKPIAVNVANVKLASIPKMVNALATLDTNQLVIISSDVGGRIAKVFFKDGQKVSKGMPIVQLDDLVDKANYQTAVTAYKLSQTEYHRSLALNKRAAGAVSQADLDHLKADVQAKSSAVQAAQASLNQKTISAPFDGTLGAFSVTAGKYVSAGQALVKLVNSIKGKVIK